MYPGGHARNTTADLNAILRHKFALLGGLASDDASALVRRFEGLAQKSAAEVASLNDYKIAQRTDFQDA